MLTKDAIDSSNVVNVLTGFLGVVSVYATITWKDRFSSKNPSRDANP